MVGRVPVALDGQRQSNCLAGRPWLGLSWGLFAVSPVFDASALSDAYLGYHSSPR